MQTVEDQHKSLIAPTKRLRALLNEHGSLVQKGATREFYRVPAMLKRARTLMLSQKNTNLHAATISLYDLVAAVIVLIQTCW